MREARVIPIINELLRENAKVVAYDPVANNVARSIFADKIEYASSALECLKGADAAILVTEWEEFRNLTPADFKRQMKNPILVDGRRIYDPAIFSAELKFTALGLGKTVNL
jgi:UDPglucose 6-dehydrogenase